MGFLSKITKPVIEAGAGILGSFMNSSSQENANATNVALSHENMKFQKHMSDTSVRRRVEDLRKAGLNPLLAVGSASAGASTPSGGQARVMSTDKANAISSILGAVSNYKATEQNIEKTKAETDRIKGMTPLDMQEKESLIKKMDSALLTDDFQRRFIGAQTVHEQVKMINTELQRKDIMAGIDLKQKTGSNLINNDELVNIQTEVAKLGLKNEQANQKVLEKSRELALEKIQTQRAEEKSKLLDAQLEDGKAQGATRFISKTLNRLNPLKGIIGGS